MGAVGAAVAGAVVAGGISAGTSAMQKGASQAGQSGANAAQQQALDQARADLAPYTKTGQNALMVAGDLSGANGPDAATAAMGNFTTSPGYQFRMDQGMRAVDASAAASGLLRSGAALKAQQTFGEGLAGSEFDNYYNRLYKLSALGENAATGTANADISTGHDIAGTDRLAASQQGSIYGAAGSGLSSTAAGLFANKDFVNKLFPGSGTAGPSFASGVNMNTTATNPAEAAYYNSVISGTPYTFTG
jgi:hypothetical protein